MLSAISQSIQDFLLSKGLKNEVLEFTQTTKTAQDAANALDCEVGQIAKSLIFKTSAGKPILVIASGVNRVDLAKLNNLVNSAVEKADPEFVKEQTGYSVGGVPPFNHSNAAGPVQVVTFIDEDLQQYDSVWVAAGTSNSVVMLTMNELVKLTEGKLVDVKL